MAIQPGQSGPFESLSSVSSIQPAFYAVMVLPMLTMLVQVSHKPPTHPIFVLSSLRSKIRYYTTPWPSRESCDNDRHPLPVTKATLQQFCVQLKCNFIHLRRLRDTNITFLWKNHFWVCHGVLRQKSFQGGYCFGFLNPGT